MVKCRVNRKTLLALHRKWLNGILIVKAAHGMFIRIFNWSSLPFWSIRISAKTDGDIAISNAYISGIYLETRGLDVGPA